jgi:predicted permease
LIFLGFCLKQKKLKLFKNPKDFFNQVDRFVFHVALPVYIFNQIAGADIDEIFNIKLVIYCVSGMILSFLLMTFTTPIFIKKKTARGAFIQGATRSNYAILALSLAGFLFGDTGSGTAALIMPFVVILFNALAVITLTLNADETPGNQNSVGKMILGIIKNPLIIASIAAVPFMLFKISFPQAIQKSVDFISNTSTPLALISLGAGIDLQVLKNKVKLSFIASMIKTVISPAVFVIPAVLLGFRDAPLVVIFVLFAAPTAVASYIMAKNMKSDYELSGQIVALTTTICPATIFAGSLILKSLGLI